MEKTTIEGKKPNNSVLENLLPNYESELDKEIPLLFTPQGDSWRSLFRKGYFNPIASDRWGQEVLDECLRGLPYNHVIVKKILRQTNQIFRKTIKMSASEIRKATFFRGNSTNTPIVTAFHVGEIFHPEEIFENLESASYHIARKYLADPLELPLDEPLFFSFRAMESYHHIYPGSVRRFADFSYKNNVITAYLINFYASIGNRKAISSFAKALKLNSDIDFEIVGEIVRDDLQKNGFQEDAIQKEVEKVKYASIRDKLKLHL